MNRDWVELEQAWREAFAQMWEAWLAGSIPVGAVLVDASGSVARRARNRIFEADRPPLELSWSRLAHAELNVLLGLSSERTYEDHTLYSTFEPCLLCLGAAYAARVGRLVFAGEDAYGGATGRVRENDDMQTHRVAVEGPLEGPFGLLAEVLPLAFFVRNRPESNVVASYRRQRPDLVDRARMLLDADLDESISLPEALDGLWPSLLP